MSGGPIPFDDVNGIALNAGDWIYWFKVYGTQVCMYEGEIVSSGQDGAGLYIEVAPSMSTGIMSDGEYRWRWRPTTKADFRGDTTKIRRVDRILKVRP